MKRDNSLDGNKKMKRDNSLDGHKKVVIGGPAYNMQVSAKHADTVAYLAIAFRMAGWKVNVWHRASSLLVENRDELLRGCITQGIDVFVSIDSDTYLHDDNIRQSVDQTVMVADYMLADASIKSNVYCVTAPVIQRNGKWNVVDNDDKHLESRPTTAMIIPGDARWCAFAYAIHRVAAYYKWFETKEPFYQTLYLKDKQGNGQPWVGEDSYHSNVITSAGGAIVINPDIITEHDI